MSQSLDGKFWVWESLEESIRGELGTMSDADFRKAWHAFATNFKGSRELVDTFEQRITS